MVKVLSRLLLRSVFLGSVLIVGLAAGITGQATVSAQEETPERNRAGRLGGTVAEVVAMWDEPSWTDAGLIGYNSILLDDIDTIVVVYHDEHETITKYALVYLEMPTAFSLKANIGTIASYVSPRDGECEGAPLKESGLGSEVYGCKSESLEGLFDEQELEQLGVKGGDGSYSYSVDPTLDDYYEIIVQFGTDSAIETPIPAPTAPPPPTPTPSLSDTYPPVPDVRELAIGRGYAVGDKLSVSGTVFNIQVDEVGTYMQIWVNAPDGSQEAVVIVYEGDSTGLFEGSWVTAYGTHF